MAGVVLTLLAWRLIVPWDLSEDPSGGGGDQHASQIALVLLVVTVVAVLLIFAGRPEARWLGAVAAPTLAVLVAWRAAVSETSGANMWPVAFVMLVVPAAAVANLLVQAAAHWRSRH